MDISSNTRIEEQRLIRFINYTMYILRTEPSIALTEDILQWTFAALGLINNAVLLLVILKSRKELLKFSSNVLLLNLAVANLLYIFTSIAVKIQTIISQEDQASSRTVMKAASVVTECQALMSNWTVAVLAIFNYYAVKSPLKFKVGVTRKKTLIIIALIWVLACSLSVPLIVMTNPRDIIANGELSAQYFVDRNIGVLMSYMLFLDVLSNAPGAIIIAILYPLILVSLCKRKRRRERSEHFRNNINNSIKRVSFIFISFIVYISLDAIVALSFLYFIVSDALDYKLSSSSYSSLKFVTAIYIPFQLCHTVLTPLIHALLTENYRKYYLPVLCRFCSGHTESTESTSKSTDRSSKL